MLNYDTRQLFDFCAIFYSNLIRLLVKIELYQMPIDEPQEYMLLPFGGLRFVNLGDGLGGDFGFRWLCLCWQKC